MMLPIRLYIMVGVWCLCCLGAGAQHPLLFMEYNVENLFDCRHDSLKQDDDFLPQGAYRWNYRRMQTKINHIAQVMLAACNGQFPDIVGLCEVENDSCMNRLVRFSPLRRAGYRYVMTHSPDVRGIDVALLYHPDRFRLLGSRSVRVPSGKWGKRPTRDILHVSGRIMTGDTLDIIVCHLPSRLGGVAASEPYRMQAARMIRRASDSVMAVREHPYLVIMGDFNETPRGEALQTVLQAGACPQNEDPVAARGLYNLMYDKKGGTYCYRGQWETIDHFLVNGAMLLPDASVSAEPAAAEIVSYPFMLEEDERYGGMIPFRTFKGRVYRKGYSDHLPLLVKLSLNRRP